MKTTWYTTRHSRDQICADTGRWLGSSTNPKITVVDTPGFSPKDDIGTLVTYLQAKVLSVNVFGIVWRQSDNRFTYEIEEMLMAYHRTFGPLFWDHVVIIVSQWNMNEASENTRTSSNPPLTKGYLTDQINKYLSRKFHLPHKRVTIFFIDTFYDQTNVVEESNFKRNAMLLLVDISVSSSYESRLANTSNTQLKMLNDQFHKAMNESQELDNVLNKHKNIKKEQLYQLIMQEIELREKLEETVKAIKKGLKSGLQLPKIANKLSVVEYIVIGVVIGAFVIIMACFLMQQYPNVMEKLKIKKKNIM